MSNLVIPREILLQKEIPLQKESVVSQVNETVREIANRSFSFVDPEFEIWFQMPMEQETWYKRFCIFLQIENFERSVLKAYNRFRHEESLAAQPSIPTDWRLMSVAWRWKERAAAFDQYKEAKIKREEEESRKKRKQKRIQFLDTMQSKLDYALNQFNPDEDFYRLSEVTNGAQIVGKEMRAELDDEPIKRSEIQVTSIADLLRESERESRSKSIGGDNIIDAEFK